MCEPSKRVHKSIRDAQFYFPTNIYTPLVPFPNHCAHFFLSFHYIRKTHFTPSFTKEQYLYFPNYTHHLEPCLSLPNCLWSYYFHPFSSMHLWVSTSMHRSTFHFFHFYFNDNFLITYNPCNRQHFLFLLL